MSRWVLGSVVAVVALGAGIGYYMGRQVDDVAQSLPPSPCSSRHALVNDFPITDPKNPFVEWHLTADSTAPLLEPIGQPPQQALTWPVEALDRTPPPWLLATGGVDEIVPADGVCVRYRMLLPSLMDVPPRMSFPAVGFAAVEDAPCAIAAAGMEVRDGKWTLVAHAKDEDCPAMVHAIESEAPRGRWVSVEMEWVPAADGRASGLRLWAESALLADISLQGADGMSQTREVNGVAWRAAEEERDILSPPYIAELSLWSGRLSTRQ